MALYEVAKEYYNDLVQRNLIQEDKYRSNHCRMHDLLHSLARFLTRGESCCIVDVQQAHTSTAAIVEPIIKLRRINIRDRRSVVFPKFVMELTALRTLTLHLDETTNFLHDSFTCLRRQRVLGLSFTRIRELPDSLFNLVHLRHLNLSWTCISILPTTISNLKNLEYLNLSCCTRLHALPKSVSDLYNLRHLDLYATPLDCIPEGIGRTRGLEELVGFALRRNKSGEGCTLEELGHLSNLRHLTIGNLEMVPTRDAAKISAIGGKAHLKELHLRWWEASTTLGNFTGYVITDTIGNFTANVITNEEKVIMEEVMEELCPPLSIEKLVIVRYMGHELPSWMPTLTTPTSSILSNLKHLEIKQCFYCKQLPTVGHLPHLERLEIDGLAVTSIGSEFLYGGGGGGSTQSSSFRKLKELIFAKLSILEEWQWVVGEEAMPRLETLQIRSCPKLGSLPGGLSHHATSLKELSIVNNERMQELDNFLSVQELTLIKVPCLTRLSNLPALTSLTIDGCPSLKTVESMKALRELELYIPGVTSIPDWLSQLTPNFIRINKCDWEREEMTRKTGGFSRFSKKVLNVDLNADWEASLQEMLERSDHEDSH